MIKKKIFEWCVSIMKKIIIIKCEQQQVKSQHNNNTVKHHFDWRGIRVASVSLLNNCMTRRKSTMTYERWVYPKQEPRNSIAHLIITTDADEQQYYKCNVTSL